MNTKSLTTSAKIATNLLNSWLTDEVFFSNKLRSLSSGMFSPHRKRVGTGRRGEEILSRYCWSVSSTKRHVFGIIDLDGGWKLFYSGADPSMSAQAGVEFSQALSCQTVCLLGFLWDHWPVCCSLK